MRSPTRLAAAYGVLAALLAPIAAPAGAADGPVYQGLGWRAWTSKGIYSISSDPYEVVFASEQARDRLSPTLKRAAAQITDVTGVQVTVSTTIIPGPRPSCADQPRHLIRFHYKYRPVGEPGMSYAFACAAAANGSAWGGNVMIDSEYWSTCCWFSNDPIKNRAMRRNVVVHELGHVFGLAHPNYDRDGDGTVEAYECVRNADGRRPVMCTPAGGYLGKYSGGKYTSEFDEPGLKQMAANYYQRQGGGAGCPGTTQGPRRCCTR